MNRLGGNCIPLVCDHRDDAQVAGVFQQIAAEQGRLDILVNNVWGGYEHFNNGTEFWKESGFWTAPLSRWDSMFQAGCARALCCQRPGCADDDCPGIRADRQYLVLRRAAQ